MPHIYPQLVGICNTTTGGLLKKSKCAKFSAMPQAEYEYREIGKRLERLRQGIGNLSQRAWAEKHGFNPTQYNNWEKGFRRIPVEAAEKLCDIYGLTLDAIYRGRLDGLSETARKVF